MATLNREKSNVIIEEIGKILQDHEKDGLSKNELTDILSKNEICAKQTYYDYENEIKKSGIMKFKKVGGWPRIFPTQKNKKTEDFKQRIRAVKKLLEVIEKHPEIGDCVSDEDIRKIPELKNEQYKALARLDNYVETISVKNTKSILGKNDKAYSLQARYNILKNLPVFLIDFINQVTCDSNRQEFFSMINPLMLKCTETIQTSYVDSVYYSSQYSASLKSSVDLYLIAGLPVSDIRAEFLRIIGRFYFLTSLRFSDGMKFDSSPEQKIIADFIEQFFSRTNIDDDDIAKKIEDGEIQSFIADEGNTRRFMSKAKFVKLMAIKNSFGGKFAIRRERYQDDDPFAVFDYYCDKCVFHTALGLFHGIERRYVEAYVKYNEDYEQEATHLEHNNPLEYNKIPFKGNLVKDSSGKGVVILQDRYDKVEPWKSKNVVVLLDN